jgi:hypothetical protein
MKKIVKYTPLAPQKNILEQDRKKLELSNKSLVLMRQQNLFLTKGDPIFQNKIIEFNNYLKNKNVKIISKLIKQMLTQKL